MIAHESHTIARSRRRLSLLILLVLGLVAAACNGDDPGSPDETAEAPADTEAGEPEDDIPDAELVTSDRIGRVDAPFQFDLNINAFHSHQTADEEQAAAMRTLYAEWARANPDWRINVRITPDAQVGQGGVRLIEEVRAGRGPDCANVNNPLLLLFMQEGLLQPITSTFSQEEIDDFYPFIQELAIQDGELYGFWWQTGARVLLRRTDLVPEQPETWDDVIDFALAAQDAQPGISGLLFNGGRWIGTAFDAIAYYLARGGELVDRETWLPIFHEGENREHLLATIGFLQRAIDEGAAPDLVTTITDYREMQAPAVAGDVAMYVATNGNFVELARELPPDEFEQWSISALPGEEPGQFSTTTGGFVFVSFSHDPEKVEKCMDFARSVYYGPANEALNSMPTSAGLFESLETFQTPEYQPLREILQYGDPGVAGPLTIQILSELGTAINAALSGSDTAEAAIDDAAARVARAADQIP